jgi:hypothetical protein
MKKLLYPIGFLLAIVAGAVLMGPMDKNDSLEGKPSPTIQKQAPENLEAYAQQIAGLWETPSGDEEEEKTGFSLLIDPRLISDGQLKIVESEYCRPGMAEYLHFILKEDKLSYTGASLDGCFFDLDRIHFIDIWYEIIDGDTVLQYEAAEMEYENYSKHTLYHQGTPDHETNIWRCALQSHLIALLRENKVNIYDAEGEPKDPQILFADESMFGGVYYYDAYTAFWPDYEEICYQAPFDIVILGGVDKQIYAIDWQPDSIFLYSTFTAENEQDQLNWLKKGSLRYTIIPDEPQPKPETDTQLFK